MPKEKPEVNLEAIKNIESAVDFYAWRNHILNALQKANSELYNELEKVDSIYTFYTRKKDIIEALKL